jgi:pyruvate/2-oxoglutarate dehydrogenase complex dihydrolipoamide acyltransferase (E2) component
MIALGPADPAHDLAESHSPEDRTMLKTISVGAVLAFAAAVGPAAAQSWGFGVGVDTRIPIYGAPPVYYDEPPVYYDAPRVVVPREGRVFRMEAPEVVLDRLDAAGYRDLSPMARRGTLYKLSAVAPEGDVVALEISIFTGEIERERVLQPRRQRPARAVAAPKRTRTAAAPAPKPEPKVAATVPAAPPATVPATPSASPGAPGSTLRDRLKPLPPGSGCSSRRRRSAGCLLTGTPVYRRLPCEPNMNVAFRFGSALAD